MTIFIFLLLFFNLIIFLTMEIRFLCEDLNKTKMQKENY